MPDATKKCPFCAEEIKAEAVKCRFCKEMLKQEEMNTSQAEPTATVSTATKPQPIQTEAQLDVQKSAEPQQCVVGQDRKQCPSSGESVNIKATKCRFCGDTLSKTQMPIPQKDCPFCGEKIQANTASCEFCNSTLPTGSWPGFVSKVINAVKIFFQPDGTPALDLAKTAARFAWTGFGLNLIMELWGYNIFFSTALVAWLLSLGILGFGGIGFCFGIKAYRSMTPEEKKARLTKTNSRSLTWTGIIVGGLIILAGFRMIIMLVKISGEI